MADGIALLRKLATRHDDVEQGIACPGTAMERHTIAIGNKAFLFFGAGDALVKLVGSLREARRLAAREPTRYRVGANGWVKLMFADQKLPPRDLLERWIAESYALAKAKPKSKSKPKPKPRARRAAKSR